MVIAKIIIQDAQRVNWKRIIKLEVGSYLIEARGQIKLQFVQCSKDELELSRKSSKNRHELRGVR
jgi:K+-sensing histidine kinase KdpD